MSSRRLQETQWAPGGPRRLKMSSRRFQEARSSYNELKTRENEHTGFATSTSQPRFPLQTRSLHCYTN